MRESCSTMQERCLCRRFVRKFLYFMWFVLHFTVGVTRLLFTVGYQLLNGTVISAIIQIVDKLISNSETRDDNNNRVTPTVKC